MARPPSIDENALLETARQVFIEKGFSVTTAEIAQRAGVSEGTLFHRFGSKAGLFQAAMAQCVAEPLAELDLLERVGKGDIEIQLIEVVDGLVGVLMQIFPTIMMSWSNRTDAGFPEALRAPNPPPLRVLRALASYLDAEIRGGRIRSVDPEILARTLLGGAMHYVFIETLGALHGQIPLPRGIYVRGLVDIVLSGARPAPSVGVEARGSMREQNTNKKPKRDLGR
jgi:AcrR family transcriptional regulator